MSASPASPGQAATSPPEPPFSPAIVDEALRAVARAWRAQQLYLANNPTRAKALEAARLAFAPVWAEAESVTLSVRETHLAWHGVPILKEGERGADALPWLLYRDGLRELTLSEGFEGRDLGVLLELLQRVRAASPDEDDLLTLLWIADLPTVRYNYVDLGADGEHGPLEGKGATMGARGVSASVREEAPAFEGPPPTAEMVRMEDLAETLYFLDPAEAQRLRDDLGLEYATDPRRGVASALLDIIETQPDGAVRAAAAGAVETLFVESLAGRRYAIAAYLLRELDVLVARTAELAPAVRAQLTDLGGQLSSPAAVEQLLDALGEASSAPRAEDVEALFAALRAAALEPLVRWLALPGGSGLRVVVERAALRLAGAHTAEVVRLLGSGDGELVRGAAQLAGRIRTAAAVPVLGRLLTHADAAVRLAAVQALAAIGTAGSLQALDRALEDGDRTVRLAALRGVAEHRHAGSATRLRALLDGKAARSADVTERVALFEAYAAVAQEDAVPALDQLLNARGLLGPRESPDVRAAAARALGGITSARARAALEKSAADKELVVRTAVVRALRGDGARERTP